MSMVSPAPIVRTPEPPSVGQRLRAAFKSLFGYGSINDWYSYRSSTWDGTWRYANTSIDYNALAGDLDQNAILMACIHWLMSAWPESRCRVMLDGDDGDTEQNRHPLTQLLNDPNPHYDGLLLWQATIASFNLTGNAYWLTFPSQSDSRPIRIYYEPHMTIRPAWPGPGDPRLNTDEGFISNYEIYRDHKWEYISSDQVVHFKFGMDPSNPRMGINKLKSAMREIYTDNEAANYTATLMRNMGVLGLIVSPKGDAVFEDPAQVKAMIQGAVMGDQRGSVTVLDGPVDVNVPPGQANNLSLREVRWTPETRIPALLNLDPGIVGLDVGLQRNTMNNRADAREQAYEQNIIPTQRLMTSTLTRYARKMGLLRDDEYVEFDISKVRVLQEDNVKIATATATVYDSGIISRAAAKKRIGENPEPGDEKYYKAGPNSANASLEDAAAREAEKTRAKAEAARASTERLQMMQPGQPMTNGNGAKEPVGAGA